MRGYDIYINFIRVQNLNRVTGTKDKTLLRLNTKHKNLLLVAFGKKIFKSLEFNSTMSQLYPLRKGVVIHLNNLNNQYLRMLRCKVWLKFEGGSREENITRGPWATSLT